MTHMRIKPHEIGATKALVASLTGTAATNVGSAECTQALAHPDGDLGNDPMAARIKIADLKAMFEKVGE